MRARLNLWFALLVAFPCTLTAARSVAQDQGPPPGYYAPVPGPYAPPPGYAGAPQAEPAGPAFKRGFLAMPYLGLHIPVGDSSDSLDPGFRMGVILGGRVLPQLSLNGEFALDVLNLKNVPAGVDVTAVIVDMTFSPLIHLDAGTVEAFLGPRLGGFGMSDKMKSGSTTAEFTGRGLAYGFNVGLVAPVGNVGIGGLLSYTGRHATRVCSNTSGTERCTDDPSGGDLKEITITAAVIF